MPQRFEPKLDILPLAQKEIWTSLAPASQLNFVLYDGTAIALHLGHRESLDFDFFRSDPLDKDQIRAKFGFVRGAAVLQDAPETLVISAGSACHRFFNDGDLNTLSTADRDVLRNARDQIGRLPQVHLKSGSLTGR